MYFPLAHHCITFNQKHVYLISFEAFFQLFKIINFALKLRLKHAHIERKHANYSILMVFENYQFYLYSNVANLLTFAGALPIHRRAKCNVSTTRSREKDVALEDSLLYRTTILESWRHFWDRFEVKIFFKSSLWNQRTFWGILFKDYILRISYF